MKTHSLTSIFNYSAAFLFTLVLPGQAFGIVGASIHPADSIDSLQTLTDTDGYIYINPGLDPITSSEGYSHTTSVEVDQSTGQIRGYSGYSLDTPTTITRTGNLIDTVLGTGELALVANTSGSIYYDATVNGGGNTGTSFATVFLDVEGSFNYEFGAPALGLLGVVSLNVAPGGDFLNSLSYLVGGQFSNLDEQTFQPDANSLNTREDVQVFDSLGNLVDISTLPDFSPDVQFNGMDPSALSMRLSLSVPIQDGDRWVFGGTAAGSSTHSFLEDFRDISVGDTGDVAAASGYVDFLSTAILGIELPEGFTLEGVDAPPLSIISNPTPVPLPASAWLFVSGMMGIIAMSRRRKS